MKRIGLFLIAAVLMFGVPGCGGGDNGTTTPTAGGLTLIYDASVSVASGGGAATIFFQGQSGKRVRITLTSAAAMLPYGFIEPPGGNADYTPPLETAAPGSNTAEITLTGTSGQVSFTVFDGNNVGGSVRVQIWIEQ